MPRINHVTLCCVFILHSLLDNFEESNCSWNNLDSLHNTSILHSPTSHLRKTRRKIQQNRLQWSFKIHLPCSGKFFYWYQPPVGETRTGVPLSTSTQFSGLIYMSSHYTTAQAPLRAAARSLGSILFSNSQRWRQTHSSYGWCCLEFQVRGCREFWEHSLCPP